jgi:hypothetical protein
VTVCPTCSEDFAGTRAFDDHRVGQHNALWSLTTPKGRRCLTTGEMTNRAFVKNTYGRWSSSQTTGLRVRELARGAASACTVDARRRREPYIDPVVESARFTAVIPD